MHMNRQYPDLYVYFQTSSVLIVMHYCDSRIYDIIHLNMHRDSVSPFLGYISYRSVWCINSYRCSSFVYAKYKFHLVARRNMPNDILAIGSVGIVVDYPDYLRFQYRIFGSQWNFCVYFWGQFFFESKI